MCVVPSAASDIPQPMDMECLDDIKELQELLPLPPPGCPHSDQQQHCRVKKEPINLLTGLPDCHVNPPISQLPLSPPDLDETPATTEKKKGVSVPYAVICQHHVEASLAEHAHLHPWLLNADSK